MIGTNTCSTKFKPIDEIKLTSCSYLTGVGIDMVPIENNHSSIANIKSSCQIFQNGNHNILTLLDAWLVLQVSL